MAELERSLTISLRISLLATFCCFVAGMPLAWALSRQRWRGRRLLDVLVNLPLALPPTLVGYYLLTLIGRGGAVGHLTTRLFGSSLIFTPAAAVIASTVVCLPLFVQAARSALEDVPSEVYEAAQVDGADRYKAFRYILLPLAWPGIWTGLLLSYARSLGEFGATLMVAGNIPGRTQTLSLAIYSAVQSGDLPRANQIAFMLTGVAAISIWVALRWRTGRLIV